MHIFSVLRPASELSITRAFARMTDYHNALNVCAAATALETLGGGHDRGQDYAELGRVLGKLGLAVIGLPVTGGRLVAAARAAGAPPPAQSRRRT